MFKLLLLVALVPALAMAQFPFRPCGNGMPTPVQVRIQGCPTSPCNVLQGGTAVMDLDFVTQSHVVTLTPTVHAHLGTTVVAYPLPPQFHNACNALGARDCPVPVNTPVTFNFRFEIDSSYPPITLGVRVTLTSNTGVETCAIMDVTVNPQRV